MPWRDLLVRLALFILVAIPIFVFDILTLIVYIVWQQPWKRLAKYAQIRSIPENVNADDDQSIVRRSNKHLPDHFLLKCRTIGDALDEAIRQHGPETTCIGYRDVICTETAQVDGKEINRYKLTDYKWLTFGDLYDYINRFGHGLNRIGVQKGDKVMIFAETSARWLICGQSIIKNGSVLVTLYSTLGDQGIIHGMEQTEVEYIITSVTLARKLIRLKSSLTCLKHIILLDSTEEDLVELKETIDSNVSVTSFEEMIHSSNANFFTENIVSVDENDLTIIMYTSGSGGIPKGVMMTHHNFMSGVKSMLSLVHFFVHEMSRHTYVAYLPLAHILEFGTETFLMLVGCKIGFSSPHTITDLSVGLMPGTKGDVTLLKPTLMASVPLVLDRIRKAIYARLNSKGLFAVRLFEFVIEYKNFWESKGFRTPIMDALFLSKFRSIVGGRLEILMTGGAPLSADTQKFIRACLNVTFAQGYGSTETGCGGLFMDENDYTLAKVGGPLYGIKVKVVDWDEGGYRTTDYPNARGEIHLASDTLSIGYYKLDQLNEEAYYVGKDGVRWFKTGDIGELFPNGTFKIIDRKKDFIKLQFGEYISLGKIETKLKTSYLVNNVCIVGNSLYKWVIAIIVPNPKVMRKLTLAVFNHHDDDISESYDDDRIRRIFLDKLTAFAKANGLRRYEIPRDVILVDDDWTPESGLVTASFKLKRKNIEQYYSDAIGKAFAKLD
ncbi:hypothetical protein RDWZM_001924 [Blomia tropicalis]|uniref:long-chain-fatty-acid--CoA ligase n=1 Tax=Blomia tropicalis TaxID=40697 RepID=A0A9Q0MCW0_BLOTA|nr:hypothetical protein RDWZM_001924 [Blomia tropicalis]